MSDIKTYRSPKVEVRHSEVAGLGVFCGHPIVKNEVVWIRSGHIVQTEEALRLDKEVGDYSVQIDSDFYLCPRTKEEVPDIVVHFNHSCNPNVGVNGQVTWVAMRDISPGEELTSDYSTFTAGPYRLNCSCGSAHCRKLVTGDDWKRPEIRTRYEGYFSWYIQKKIRHIEKA